MNKEIENEIREIYKKISCRLKEHPYAKVIIGVFLIAVAINFCYNMGVHFGELLYWIKH